MGSFQSTGTSVQGLESPEARRRREEEEAERGRRRAEEAVQLQGSPLTRSAISEAQLRQEEARRQAEEDRFGTFQSIDDRLPVQSDLGGLPAFNSSGSRRAGAVATPSSRSPASTPLSRPQEQRRNEARQTLRTTLEGSMREDPTVLQWALSEAQQAGVAEVDPALISEGERALESVNTGQREQAALQRLRGALDATPRNAQALRAAVDEARAAGLSAAQLQPALAALQEEEERSRSLAADERERQVAEALRISRLQELREAAHGGDPDRLSRAIDLARAAGVAKVAVQSAEANLLAIRFVGRKLERTPVLRAWRAHAADLRAARWTIKEAIHDGVGAEELDQAIDAAVETGVDETTCEMARVVASHRRSAHDQAACALASMDVEELHEAKAMNEAAGGPKSDVGHLLHAIAEAEEDAKMLQSWDDGLPAAVDMYFEQLELEQEEAKARIAKASTKRAQEEGRKVGTPLQSASSIAQKPAVESDVAAGALLQQGAFTSNGKEAFQRPATPPISRPEIRPEDEEEWEKEYLTMKSKVERARRWFAMQEQHHQHEELLQHFPGHLQGSQAPISSSQTGKAIRTSPISRRRHVCGPDDAAERGPQQLQQPQVPRSMPSRRKPICGPGGEDDPAGAPTQMPATMQTQMPAAMRTQMPAAMRTQMPDAMQTQMPASVRTQSPTRVLPSRRRHICGADGEQDQSAASPPTQASSSRAQPPSQDRRTPPPSRAQQELHGGYSGSAALPVDQTQVWLEPPSPFRTTMDMPFEERLAALRRAPAAPASGLHAAPAPVQSARQQPPARSSTSPVLSAREPAQASRALPGRRRPLCGNDGEEAGPPGVPQSAPQAAEPKVQASRNMPSRYKPGYSSSEELWSPAPTQQSTQARQGRPVLLGQQQSPPYGFQYGANELSYADGAALESDYRCRGGAAGLGGGVGGPVQVPMVPGAETAGGAGYSYENYEGMRGASTFHNLMANAARIARKPEVEPRRNYEDPTFWR